MAGLSPVELCGMEISETDRAWLAGLVEGEGCFTCNRKSKSNLRYADCPAFAMAMTDLDIVQRAQAVTGLGLIKGPYTKGRSKPIYYWYVSKAHEASALALWLYPYLGERRRSRIRELVEPWMALDHFGQQPKTHCLRGHPFDEENTYVWESKSGRRERVCRTCRRMRLGRAA